MHREHRREVIESISIKYEEEWACSNSVPDILKSSIESESEKDELVDGRPNKDGRCSRTVNS
jgi:hypothetical protein